MTIFSRGVRQRSAPGEYDARSLGDQIRDLDAFRGIGWAQKTCDMLYTEPMWVGEIFARPAAIIVGSVVDMNAQESPVSAGGIAHFVWDGQRNGAKITKIDGLTQGKQYRFNFLIAHGRGR